MKRRKRRRSLPSILVLGFTLMVDLKKRELEELLEELARELEESPLASDSTPLIREDRESR